MIDCVRPVLCCVDAVGGGFFVYWVGTDCSVGDDICELMQIDCGSEWSIFDAINKIWI
jgi:hypothetical protein